MQLAIRILGCAVFAFYAIPLLIITPLLNIMPGNYVAEHYGRTLATEWVVLNPFKLSLDIKSAALSEPDGEAFLALADSSINLSLSSLWRPGVVLDELTLQDLYLRLERINDDTFNFSDLLPETAPENAEPASPDEPLPAITIRVLDFNAREIVASDQAREAPYESSYKNLDFRVEDLSTVVVDGRPYTLSVTGPDGGTLQWKGSLSIPAQRSEGSFQLAGLSANNLWRVAQPWLPFVIPQGRLDLSADYTVGWGEPLSFKIANGALAVQSLTIEPPVPETLEDTSVTLSELRVTDISADSSTQMAAVESVSVDGLAVSGWSEGAEVSLQQLFTGASEEQSAPPTAEPTPGEPKTEESTAGEPTTARPATTAANTADEQDASWQASLASLQLTDSTINWRSEYTEPPVLSVTPIEARLKNLNWPLAGETAVQLSLMVNEASSLSIDGAIDLGEGSGEIRYDLSGLPLPWFNPNLPAGLHMTITDGSLATDGTVQLQDLAPATVSLDAQIRNLATTIVDEEQVLQGLQSLRIESLAVDIPGRAVVVDTVALAGYNGRLHILADGSVNASKVLREEVGEQADEVVEDLAEEGPWQFAITHIVFAQSAIDFMDQSLPIPFRTLIEDINGQIEGMSSEPGARAEVDIKGSVDGYSPVVLNGTVNPFAEPVALDLGLSFSGVDMALLSPYSGTYAGYEIESGLLDLDLTYALENNGLQGQNRIRLGQLKLGDKIESEKAVDVPLELALSIMTDSDGVVDMDIPVSGNVDDPSFHLGSVISKAVIGLITKVVTAPFTLLANLVDSEEDLKLLNFPTGRSEPDGGGAAKLDKLAEALQQRPKLTLIITGRINRAADTERLQKDTFDNSLREAGLDEQELKLRGDRWSSMVQRRYDDLGMPTNDEEVLSIRDKRLAVAKTYTITDATLEQLAQDRAVAVKTYLVNEAGLPADRAVVNQSPLSDEGHRFSGAELSVK